MNNVITDPNKLYSAIEQDKAVFKIVTKTKNERFFIEKWITHHLNIVQDAKLIIFDNMSDDEHVHSVYRKYKDNILLIKFYGYMDCIHMANKFMRLYETLAASSSFFTIIDSDEYLYLYDDGKLIKDNAIVKFLEANADCNFFAPCWLENKEDNEKLLSFNPHNLECFHGGKPIVNAQIVRVFETALTQYECPIIHHTHLLPVLTYGKTKTKFLLAHLKNLNKYQRIKINMLKLLSLNVVRHDKDFSTLLRLDMNALEGGGRYYAIETKKLIESILDGKTSHADKTNNETIELCDDGTLIFTHESHERDFKRLMSSDYFTLINFDAQKIDVNSHTTINSCFPLCKTS